jgi:hypothetical protein
MRPRAILLITTAALALTPSAASAASATRYTGKTSEGRAITITVAGTRIVRAATHVMCGGSPSSVVFDAGGRIRHGRFSVGQDNLLSGTGGEDETVHFDGRVRPDKITGNVTYDYEAVPPPDAGPPSACAGQATFKAKRVRR